MQPKSSLAEVCFSSADQLRFADISGDRNPMHIDPVYARRTQFGRQVVHGVHLLLWALDRYFTLVDAPRPAKLDASFSKPAFVGERVCLVEGVPAGGERHLEIVASEVTVARVTLASGSAFHLVENFTHPDTGRQSVVPRELGLADLQGLTGTIDLHAGAVQAALSFGRVSRVLGDATVSALLAASRLVGMECPGLHSIFAGLRVDLRDAGRSEQLSWHVFRIDSRFRKIDLDVCGGGIAGRLETFVRIPPAKQASMEEIGATVEPNEFAGQSALIVGGSRGLGEVTAKIIAAGGGTSVISYAVGKEDADRVATEIAAAGLRCSVIRYDASLPAAPQLARLDDEPMSFYYFATCSIFRRKAAFYEAALCREFLSFYVDGFYNLCSELRARQTGKLVGFYPSTVAIDSRLRDLTEYCLAKVAGESLCAQLRHYLPDFEIIVERLPRIETDQTATLLPVHAEQSLDVMLPLVRRVQAASSPSMGRPESEGSRANGNRAKRRS